jgi:hypothetical protein
MTGLLQPMRDSDPDQAISTGYKDGHRAWHVCHVSFGKLINQPTAICPVFMRPRGGLQQRRFAPNVCGGTHL